MKKQVYNPFLPLYEYIPDGEPHVFDGRVYIYGSHDREGGWTFCMDDYMVWSAPEDDLSDWRCEGVSYRAKQDPMYPDMKYMYAPDVVRGNDGRYYLYYCMSGDYGVGGYRCPISVAVSDKPAGEFEYLGHVKYPDGSLMMKYVCFDPAVINDGGVIRLYYGTQYEFEEQHPGEDWVVEREADMYGRTREEILSYPDSINGPVMLVLEDDMLTVKEEPHHIIPYKVKGTGFEEHPFFEGSSMRKAGDKYYFVYSSQQNHELCYAVSDKPDADFVFGGTIVSNGDVGLNGRRAEDRLNMTGTTHGSIEKINGEWYVFYHRLTHKSDYSRQACAEKISILPDGSIAQAEITSCGLNGGALKAEGTYPAAIACNITNGHMPHGCNSIYSEKFPNVNHRILDGTEVTYANVFENREGRAERFIAEIEDGTLIGFKYFDFKNVKKLTVSARVENEANEIKSMEGRKDERSTKLSDDGAAEKDDLQGTCGKVNEDRLFIDFYTGDERVLGSIEITEGEDPLKWYRFGAEAEFPDGEHALFLKYRGTKRIQLKDIAFS